MRFLKGKDGRTDHQKIIAGTTVLVVLLIRELFPLEKMELFFSSFINVSWIVYVLSWFIPWLVDVAGFAAIFWLFSVIYKKWWERAHKDYYLEGIWLHIHDKENPRTGLVQINQDFYNIDTVKAINVDPNADDPAKRQTEWEYIGNTFKPAPIDYLVSCYSALRRDTSGKYGVHVFSNPEISEKGYPVKVKGRFGDIIKKENLHTTEVYDKTGKLYLFKLSKDGIDLSKKEIKELLRNPSRLANINNYEKLKNSEYGKILNQVMEKNGILQRYNDLSERIKASPTTDISVNELDVITINLLFRIIFSDGRVNQNEVDLLNDLFKKDWKRDYINALDSDSVIAKLDILKSDETMLRVFKEIIIEACVYIIKLDNTVHINEQQCLESIKTLLAN